MEIAGALAFVLFCGIVIGSFVFWIWMLVDCATKEPEGNEKLVWVLIIVFTHIVGALIYFFVRRPKRWQLAHR